MNKAKTPLVSIGMSVYNEEKYISQALNSLLAQDFKDFELIISDNASTDATQQICLDYVTKDKRIQYYRNEKDMGGAWNFNRIFKLSSGKYFMCAGAHDMWDKTFINRCAEILNNDSSVVLCYPQTMLIDLEDNELGIMPDNLDTRFLTDASQRFHRTMWELTWCNIIYGLIRSNALRKTRLSVPVIGLDHLLLAELSLIGTFVQIPLPLFYRRQNRPDEDGEQALRRHLKTIAPNMNVTIPYSLLMLQHLFVVANAPLHFRHKLKLVVDVLKRFHKRGVLDELLRVAHLLSVYRCIRKISKILLSHLGPQKKR